MPIADLQSVRAFRTDLPTFHDVESAAARIAGVAHRTPVVTSRSVDERTGARVFFKCENLQRAGAFKFRGAYNALSRLTADERRRGVLAFSSGNHAQAVALAGQLLDIPSRHRDADRRARRQAGRHRSLRRDDRRRTIANATIAKRSDGALRRNAGLTIVPPYDHPHIVAGAGTAARELIEEVGPLDLLLVPCGGGGLLSGSALAARAMAPAVPRRRRRTSGGRRCDAIVPERDPSARRQSARRSPTARGRRRWERSPSRSCWPTSPT